ESRRAAAAAAWGEAWEVPRKVEVPPPMPDEVMGAPGARSSTLLELFEKQATSSRLVVASVHPKVTVPPSLSYTAPTATALEMQAGTPIWLADPLLRVEAKVMVPRARSALMAWARA